MAEPGGRRGLGRGLSALLDEDGPAAAPAVAPPPSGTGPFAPLHDEGVSGEVPIELLRRNPTQPRRTFAEEELDELAASIKEKGVLQPILVRPAPGAKGEYQIVAGERRWRAAQRAGLETVPVLMRRFDDVETAEIAIVENVQRVDLNPLEEAQGFKVLMDRFDRTQDTVAKVVGKSRSHVANALRLLALPEGVRDHLAAGRLSAGHARAIASAPDPDTLARTIVERGLSVRDAEQLARTAQGRAQANASDQPPSKAARAAGRKSADTCALEHDLSEALGLTVQIDDRNGKGELRVSYKNLEQLDDICRRLSGG